MAGIKLQVITINLRVFLGHYKQILVGCPRLVRCTCTPTPPARYPARGGYHPLPTSWAYTTATGVFFSVYTHLRISRIFICQHPGTTLFWVQAVLDKVHGKGCGQQYVKCGVRAGSCKRVRGTYRNVRTLLCRCLGCMSLKRDQTAIQNVVA